MKKCPQCGNEVKGRNKFCNSICYFKFPKSDKIKLKIKESVLKAYKNKNIKQKHFDNTPRGKNHPMFGKKHKEDSINKIRKSCKLAWNDEMKNKQKQRMLNGQAAYCNKFIKNPSKPQFELFKLIKEIYPNSELNFQILNYSIDIAIPKFKLAIEYDKRRQREVESLGWKFIRY